MKLYYDTNGEIIDLMFDKDKFIKQARDLPTYEIDEFDQVNQELCIDIHRNFSRQDVNGLGKYHIENSELYTRDGWEHNIDLDLEVIA